MQPNTIDGEAIVLRALLDSGASSTIVAKNLLLGFKLDHAPQSQVWATPAGDMTTNQMLKTTFTFDELQPNKTVGWNFHVATLKGYDMIIGRDMMSALGIDVLFSQERITWEGFDLPFKEYRIENLEENFFIPDPEAVASLENRMGIQTPTYAATQLEDYVLELKYLSPKEQAMLLRLLKHHAEMFDGKLGTWKGTLYHIELQEDAKPYHARAFPVPCFHDQTFGETVEMYVRQGILRKINISQWAAPSYIIPKKNGQARFITDFRELNKRIKHKPYPIPKISEMLQRMEKFTYATSIDLNMGYYHITLDQYSQSLCTIVLPWANMNTVAYQWVSATVLISFKKR